MISSSSSSGTDCWRVYASRKASKSRQHQSGSANIHTQKIVKENERQTDSTGLMVWVKMAKKKMKKKKM